MFVGDIFFIWMIELKIDILTFNSFKAHKIGNSKTAERPKKAKPTTIKLKNYVP